MKCEVCSSEMIETVLDKAMKESVYECMECNAKFYAYQNVGEWDYEDLDVAFVYDDDTLIESVYDIVEDFGGITVDEIAHLLNYDDHERISEALEVVLEEQEEMKML